MKKEPRWRQRLRKREERDQAQRERWLDNLPPPKRESAETEEVSASTAGRIVYRFLALLIVLFFTLRACLG